MKNFSGDPVEIVFTPTQLEMDNAVKTARILMAQKLDAWILDQLTIEQLKRLHYQIGDELARRGEL